MRDRQFSDKWVFIEDYDINVGRHLTQGSTSAQQSARPLEAPEQRQKVV